MDTPVLIVGAGPTGLLLAAELRRRGVECTLIDAREEANQWDRATIVHTRTLELMATIGLADRFLAAGVHQRGIQIFSAGEQLAAIDLADSGSRYGFSLDVSEEVTESIVAGHLEAHGGAVLRGHKLVGLREEGDHLLATIEHDGGSEGVRAAWVVGCGGLRSPVRELTGIPFEGHDIPEPWAVFDVTLAGWTRELDVNFAFFDQPPVIITPLPGARWRAYLRPSSPDSDLVAEAAAVLGRYDPGAELVEVENPRRFDCHTKVAARYREGRALLAGDAAHVCTPGQGHGMNTGIQDSFNLAWKLAHVVAGEAGEALLDSYEVERRPVALGITASGDEMEASLMIGDDPAARAGRDRTIAAAFADPASNRREVMAETELNIDYAGSPIVSGASELLAAGSRIPTRLQELLAIPGHTLVVAVTDDESHAAGAELLRFRLEDDLTEFFDDSMVLRTDEELARQLAVDGLTLFAVRPDQHFGLRHDEPDPAAIRAYVERVRSGGRGAA